MIALIYVCMALEVVFLPTFVKSGFPQLTKKSLAVKTVCSALFLAAAVFARLEFNKLNTLGWTGSYFILIFLGLVCGFIGDVLLTLEPVLADRKKVLDAMSILGGVAFLAGHVLYIIAFAKQMKLYGISFGAVFFISFAIVFLTVAALKFILKVKTGKLTVPVIIYALMIDFMFSAALTLCVGMLQMDRDTFMIMIVPLGALLFVISDLNLALKIFDGKRFHTIKNRWLYVCTYYAAQFLIAMSICFLA